MAVIKSLLGVVVTVRAEKRNLREYTDSGTPDAGDTATRYIQAQSDSYFEIQIYVGAGTRFQGDSISFLVHVDGNETEFPFVMRTSGSTTIHCVGALLPGNRLRRYKFENLQLVEDVLNDGKPSRKQRFAELGTIKIEAYHDRVLGRTDFINDDASYGNLGPVSEKDVKGQAISQSIGFGAAQKIKFEPEMYQSERLDPSGKPAAVYIFRYRSQDGLRAEHIIGNQRSQPSEKGERKIKSEERKTKHEPGTEGHSQEDGHSTMIPALAQRGSAFHNERDTRVSIKREEGERSPRQRKASRPSGDITFIDLDDDGNIIAERSVPRPQKGPEIELED